MTTKKPTTAPTKTAKRRSTPRADKQPTKQRAPRRGNGRAGQGERVRQYQWKPGQSGNPKGRPKGLTFATIARQILNEPVLDKDGRPRIGPDGEAITRLHELAEAVIQRALEGSPTDLIELLARIDPKPKQGSTDTTLDIRVGIGPDREVEPYAPPLGVDRLRELPRGNNGNAG